MLYENWQIKGFIKSFVTFLWEADELTGWHSGFELTGINIKKKKDHWLLIVKVHDGRRPMVAFFKQPNYWRTIFSFGWNLEYGDIKWIVDKWP